MGKRLRVAICLLSALLFLPCGIYGAEGQTSIAVCSFAAMSPIQPETGRITAMLLSKTLSSNVGWRVLSPNSSESLAKVPSSEKQAIAAAKALQVEFVITGTLSDTPSGQMLDFTLWSVNTGESVLVESIQIGPDDKRLFDGLELINTRVKQTASAPGSPIPGRDPGLPDIPPDTRPGSVLAVGQTWWQDGVGLTLSGTYLWQYDPQGIAIWWEIENLTEKQVIVQFGSSSFSAVDNNNRIRPIAIQLDDILHGGQLVSIPAVTFTLSSVHAAKILNLNKDDINSRIGLTLLQEHGLFSDGDMYITFNLRDTSIREILVTVSIGRLKNARWRIPVERF